MAAKEKLTYILYGGLTIVIFAGIFLAWKYLRGDIVTKPNQFDTKSAASSQTFTGEFHVRGSIPYWEETAAFLSFQKAVQTIDSVSLFWYYLTSEGRLAKYKPVKEASTIIDFAHKNGKKVSLVVTNLPEEAGTSWDSKRVENTLSDPEKRALHIDEIKGKVFEWGFDGVTIDYEEVDPAAEKDFTKFIKELSDVLHTSGKFVGVALHPKLGVKSDRQYDFQNWKDLATYVDELYIMAYGEHWDEGAPGPIASASWVEKIIEYALLLDVPLHKFYLGIPLYGYDWVVDSDEKAKGLTYTQVRALMLRYGIEKEWGEDTPAPFFRYKVGSKEHEVWFENAASVEEKLFYARAAGFGGVTFWRLGDEDPEVWERVAQMTTPVASPESAATASATPATSSAEPR